MARSVDPNSLSRSFISPSAGNRLWTEVRGVWVCDLKGKDIACLIQEGAVMKRVYLENK